MVVRGPGLVRAAPIASVEVSINDQPWQRPALSGAPHRGSWRPWQLPAHLERLGSVTARTRATDLAGRAQPTRPRRNTPGYAANPIHQVQISVRPARA